MDSVAPPSQQEIQRKLSMHSPTGPVPISKRNSMRQTSALSGTESDSDAGGALASSFSPSVTSQGITSEFSTSLQPLSAIAERRNPSGEETDEDDDEEDGRVFPTRVPAEKEVKDEAVIKSGFLCKKGERRKTWKKRWFVLRTAKISLYKNEQEYKLLRLVDLNDVHSVAPCELKRHSNTFAVVTPARTYYLQAENAAECESWVHAMNDARVRLKEMGMETPVPQTPPSGPAITIPTVTQSPTQAPHASSSVPHQVPASPLQHTMSSSDSEPEDEGVALQPVDPKQIVLQGYLMKCGTHMKNWRKRYFILTPETLKYGKSHMNTKGMRAVQVTQILDAIETTASKSAPSASPTTTNGDKEHIFKIITPKKSFMLCAPSEEEEIKWLSAVRALIARRAAATAGSPSHEEDASRTRAKSISTRSIAEVVGSPLPTSSSPVATR
ncbi:PH domain, partial [Rhizoctonia solani]